MRRYTDSSGRPNRHATVDHLGHREWQAEPYRQDNETLGERAQLPGGRHAGRKRFGLRITYPGYSWAAQGMIPISHDKYYASERQRNDALRGINAKSDILKTRAEIIPTDDGTKTPHSA